MEPSSQFSTVPYSLMDIQLPESPGDVKSKSTSDLVESDSVNIAEEMHSNGIVNTDIKESQKSSETDSKGDSSEKVCSPNNTSYEKSGKLAQHAKESNSDDSKIVESRSHSKKKETDYKSLRSKERIGDRKTLKSKDNVSTSRDSRSKSRERKRSRMSSEDSSHRHSRSRSRERTHKLKEGSRSKSKERDRRSRKYEKESDTHKASHHRRNSRSRSKESDRKTRKSNVDSKNRKSVHSRRISRSMSNDSKSEHSSESDEESQKKKGKAGESKKKKKDQKKYSHSESDSSSSESLSRSSKQKRQDKHHKRDSSEGTQGSRSRSPAKKKTIGRSDNHSDSSMSKHGRRKNKDTDPNSRSRSRDSSPNRKKNKNVPTEKHEKSNEESIKKRSKNNPIPKEALATQSVDDSEKIQQKHRNSDNEDSNSKSQESSPVNKSLKNKSLEHVADLANLVETSKKSESSDSSRSRSRERSPIQKDKMKHKSEMHMDIKRTQRFEGESKNRRSRSRSPGPSPSKSLSDTIIASKTHKQKKNLDSDNLDKTSRNKSRESSPTLTVKGFTDESSIDSTVLTKRSRQESQSSVDDQDSKSRSKEKSPELKNSKTRKESSVDRDSRSRSKEKSPDSKRSKTRKESPVDRDSRSKSKEKSPDSKRSKNRKESPVDRDSRSKSKEKSSVERTSRSLSEDERPDPKKSKVSVDKPDVDSLDVHKQQTESSKSALTISDIPGAVKKGNILILKKEPVKQKLKIKRDNVIISSQSKRVEKEIKSEKHETTESTEENEKETISGPVRTQYVSRKIVLSSRSQSTTSDDEPKSKKSKWGNLASNQKTSTINISTDSLKNWFPDFKLLKDPTPEEPASLAKEEIDMEISINKPDEDSKQVSSTKKFLDFQREVPMDIGVEETGPVSKILFVQNLVRPFTLNQLKELLRETGNFIEQDFWIDKIKSKCFVTYETEEEAIKTRNHLNGTRWPSSNPKILSVEFSNEEELTVHQSGNDAPKAVLQTVPEPNDTQEFRVSHPVDDFRKKDHEPDRKRDRSKQMPPVREWDKDKITQESPDRERSGKDTDKSKYLDKKEKKDSKRRANEDTPAKLLDDLFQKTKSSPCIYWLPLTDEQVQERTESKRLRRLEREKRNQQREQEDVENKNKRPRSRNRTREVENKRSSTRSRSPVTRRR